MTTWKRRQMPDSTYAYVDDRRLYILGRWPGGSGRCGWYCYSVAEDVDVDVAHATLRDAKSAANAHRWRTLGDSSAALNRALEAAARYWALGRNHPK